MTQETCEILQHFGYSFEQRGLVAVKGKGQLMTYYLQGKDTSSQPSEMANGSPSLKVISEKSPIIGGGEPNTTRCNEIQIKITDYEDNDISSSNQPLIQQNDNGVGAENSTLVQAS